MSISHSGRASRSFIIGSRLCPPAMTRASGPCRSSSSRASPTLVGADVVERGRDLHGATPCRAGPSTLTAQVQGTLSATRSGVSTSLITDRL